MLWYVFWLTTLQMTPASPDNSICTAISLNFNLAVVLDDWLVIICAFQPILHLFERLLCGLDNKTFDQ